KNFKDIHKQSGPLRGGKYSIFEAGTRIPFIVSGPKIPKGRTSEALISQVDILTSVAQYLDVQVPKDAMDSQDLSTTLFGEGTQGRAYLIEHGGSLAILKNDWKYIEPSNKQKYDVLTDIELGNDSLPQLYFLKD